MSKRPSLIKKKISKPKISRSDSYFINKKYYGPEPFFTKKLTESEYGFCFNWYAAMCTIDEAREYLETFLLESNWGLALKRLKKVPDAWFPLTCGWIARMYSRGYELPESAYGYFTNKLGEVCARFGDETPEVLELKKKVTEDKIKDQLSDLIGEIEAKIDLGQPFSTLELLRIWKAPVSFVDGIIKYYTPWLEEMYETVNDSKGKPDLLEAYSHFTPEQLTNRILYIYKIIEEAQEYVNAPKPVTVKKPQKPRVVKKKIISNEKKLANFKFQKDSKEYEVTSIKPEKIFGASELWLFNTKYKTVTVLIAETILGLDVKGSTIIGFDQDKSMSRKTGKTSKTTVADIMKGTKFTNKRLIGELKTIANLSNRVNENILLLRVVT